MGAILSCLGCSNERKQNKIYYYDIKDKETINLLNENIKNNKYIEI